MTDTNSHPFFIWCHILFGAFWKSFLWGAAFIAIAIIVKLSTNQPTSDFISWTTLFIKELGFAFLIGSIISVGIEEVARYEHNKLVKTQMEKLNQNVIEAVYSRDFPNEIFQHIENAILNKPYLRDNLEVTFIIDYIDPSDKYLRDYAPVLIKIASSYKQINLSRESKSHAPEVFIEKPWDGDLEEYCKINNVSIDKRAFTESEILTADNAASDTENYIRFKFDEVDIPPAKSAYFEIEYQLVKLARDMTTWRTLYTCKNGRFNIIHPEDMEVFIEPIHPDEAISCGPTEGGKYRQIQIDAPLLPQNGIVLWWRPKSLATTKTDSHKEKTQSGKRIKNYKRKKRKKP